MSALSNSSSYPFSEPHPGAIALPEAGTDPAARALFDAALQCGLPVAIWRLPQGADEAHPGVEGLVTLGPPLRSATIDFTLGLPGFVFAPFSESTSGLFLRDDVRLTQEGIFVSPFASGSAACLLDAFARRMSGGEQPPVAWHTTAERPADRASTQAEFEALVRDAIRFIHEAGIAKVVVSRTAAAELPPAFHPAALFAALCDRYPHAFVSLVSAPGVGTWLGASPELLLSIDGEAVTTVALAGTQKRNGVPIEQIHWGRKEVVEQEMVSAYVRDFFAAADVAGVDERGPETVAAGGVVHLQSSFRVPLPAQERLRLANRVLGELHPTSAVCGMPRSEALAFIQGREGYDRAFYSGYLGPVHMGERSALYVNLRCMQLRDGGHVSGLVASQPYASLYVGAGITADSDPASEWRETELKARTILDALQSAALVAPPSKPLAAPAAAPHRAPVVA
jgi:isochorismate synthase